MSKAPFFAEIIESSLQNWIAQSWQWDAFPAYGSLVAIEQKKRTLFAVVYSIQTGSQDPVRTPFAYQKTEEELLAQQPQIFAFLRTTFSCLPLGYQENNKLFYLLAPEPAKMHAFVRPMSYEEKKRFFSTSSFLPLVFGNNAQVGLLEELLLAMLADIARVGLLYPDYVEQFMQDFSLLTGNDYRRLKLFLQRAQPILENHIQTEMGL